jgi:hypothetical protein
MWLVWSFGLGCRCLRRTGPRDHTSRCHPRVLPLPGHNPLGVLRARCGPTCSQRYLIHGAHAGSGTACRACSPAPPRSPRSAEPSPGRETRPLRSPTSSAPLISEPHHLRRHPSRVPDDPGCVGPGPLGHREQAALGQGRDLRRRPLPGPCRRRTTGHGEPREPRDQPATTPRPDQHRPRTTTSRRRQTTTTRAPHHVTSDFAEDLALYLRPAGPNLVRRRHRLTFGPVTLTGRLPPDQGR